MIIKVEFQKQLVTHASMIREETKGYSTEYTAENAKKVFRNVKDSLFTILFRDVKNVRKLYSVLADDNDKYNDEDFKILTLENAFIPSIYNDLGFLVGNQLIVLVEEQNTFNPNMAIRYLLYIAETYQKYIFKNNLNLYGTKKIVIPEPKFYLFYTGKRTFEEVKLKLSDSFHQSTEIGLELVVEILTKTAVKDSIIEEYLRFCELYDSNLQLSESKIEALRKTIHSCISQNILKEFLQAREREVEEMSMLLYTQEELFDIALKEKFKDGLEQGMEKSCYKIARDMKKDGIPFHQIIKYTGLTEEEVEKL
ncbi:hypothetical protein EII17_04055 [Clostridiales bacterium COT073_COT-073]|nr:hypothetical protein EII17_04055 [Clostridiales bacterium COT073_COT-073]